jgi:hypothetical protein
LEGIKVSVPYFKLQSYKVLDNQNKSGFKVATHMKENISMLHRPGKTKPNAIVKIYK